MPEWYHSQPIDKAPAWGIIGAYQEASAMVRRILAAVSVAAIAVLAFTPQLSAQRSGKAPVIPHITSADQLVPFAKIIVQRDYIGQRLGYSIKGGERVLYQVTGDVHPWVNEAFVRALKELGCSVDVVIRDNPKITYDEWYAQIPAMIQERLTMDLNERPKKRFGFRGSGPPSPPRPPGVEVSDEVAKRYDVVIGPQNEVPGLSGSIPWVTPELLANEGAVYPGDLMDLIDAKAWAVLRNAERVEISDLQGSQASFTWFPEWWEIAEGTHPKIKSPAAESTFNALRPGRSEYAIFAGHLMGHPREGAIEGTDFRGKLVATVGQDEQGEKITINHDKGQITSIEGGGVYGDFWRKALEYTKDIQYPGYFKPGTGWMSEFSIGTNPKIFGPVDVPELRDVPGRDLRKIRWGIARDEAGMVHAGYGARGASWYNDKMDLPTNHYHVRLYLVTYTVHTRDGKTVKLLDNGYLTALQDPEVRKLAATYGDPDRMLDVAWFPELTADGYLKPPPAKLIPYDEYIKQMPFKMDDPRLIYHIPPNLAKFYGKDRVKAYDEQEFIDFFKKLGQLPLKRVKSSN
jgi:hypothetical protein